MLTSVSIEPSTIITPKSCTGPTPDAINEAKPAASVAQAQKIGAASFPPAAANASGGGVVRRARLAKAD